MKLRNLALATAVLLPGAACVTTPERHVLGLMALGPIPMTSEIIERDVSAEHCGTGFYSSGNLAAAVDEALSSVDGANALVNASVHSVDRVDRVCLKVKGDAASLY